MPTRRIVSAAAAVAFCSPSRFRVGAVVYRGSKILGHGFNDMSKTHTKATTLEHKRHAELGAVLRAVNLHGEDTLRGADIYVHRLLKNGQPGNAKPCEHCEFMLKSIPMRRVEWSQDA